MSSGESSDPRYQVALICRVRPRPALAVGQLHAREKRVNPVPTSQILDHPHPRKFHFATEDTETLRLFRRLGWVHLYSRFQLLQA